MRNRWRNAVFSTSDARMQAGEPVNLRASIGTLVVLGLRDIRMAASPTTAYLMVGGQCSSDCAYCGQGRGAIGDHSRLSRISWPDVGEDELVDAFVAHPGAFQLSLIHISEPTRLGM